MTDGQIAAIATMVVAAFGALAAIGTKIVERKPARERRNAEEVAESDRRKNIFEEHALDIANLREMMAARDTHAKLQDAQILAHQKDLAAVHVEIGQLRARVSKLLGAIDRSQVRYPETREFWQAEFEQIG